MALNIEYWPKDNTKPSITIQVYKIAFDKESWFSTNCRRDYDVRANAEVECRDAGRNIAETDLEFCFLYLHK